MLMGATDMQGFGANVDRGKVLLDAGVTEPAAFGQGAALASACGWITPRARPAALARARACGAIGFEPTNVHLKVWPGARKGIR